MKTACTIPQLHEMTKPERAFESTFLRPRLTVGELQWYAFEPMKLKLANNCTYTPDFMALDADGKLWAFEVKAWWKGSNGKPGRVGFMDDARVKIKVAAREYPFLLFRVVWQREGVWDEEEIAP